MDERPSCLNCGAELTGAYCAYCGQDSATARLKLRTLLRDLADDVFALDSRHVNTFRRLIVHPGIVARDYIDGRRVGIMSPLRYYLLALGSNVAVGGLLDAVLQQDEPTAKGVLDTTFVALQIGLAFMALLLPLGAGLRLTHETQRFNVLEHYSFVLYAAAQGVLAVLASQLVLALLGLRLPADVDGIIWLVVGAAVIVQGGRELYGERWWVVATKLIGAFAFAIGTLAVVTMLGAVIRRLV